jgi:hypothetical protein
MLELQGEYILHGEQGARGTKNVTLSLSVVVQQDWRLQVPSVRLVDLCRPFIIFTVS